MAQPRLRPALGLFRLGMIAVLLLGTLSITVPPASAIAPFTDSGTDLIGVGDAVTAWGDYDADVIDSSSPNDAAKEQNDATRL